MEINFNTAKAIAVENTQFIHVPGPNPILLPGKKGEWDEDVIEMCDILNDGDKYYLYYHGTGQGKHYRIGAAVSDHPLGPFKKYGGNPILDLGPEGDWDDTYVACGTVLKEGTDRYYMWYTAVKPPFEAENFHIGLATASNPLGPWKKYENNPVLKSFGYVGGVVKRNGKYHLYTEHPINYKARDYGPMSVALSDCPEGPWHIYPENPALGIDEWGVWDDAGYSEANVRYDGNVFHMFYGGARVSEPRMKTKESIGYAYSFDGYNFMKYGKNPVACRNATPYGAAYSEVCALFELPLIYLYHTLRYKEPWRDEEKEKFPVMEHIGVQVLATGRPFGIDVPFMQVETAVPGETVGDRDRMPLNLGNINSMTITVKCSFGLNAQKGIRLHVKSSNDGYSFDTNDVYSFDVESIPGKTVQKTMEINTIVHYADISIENLDMHEKISDIKVSLYLKG